MTKEYMTELSICVNITCEGGGQSLYMQNNITKSIQLGTLDGKDMVSDHFGFSQKFFQKPQ